VADELIGLRLKEIGDLKAVESLGATVELVLSGRMASEQVYSFVSLELDKLSGITGVDAARLTDFVLRDKKKKGIFEGLKTKIHKAYGKRLESDVIESLIKTSFALDILNSFVSDSGSVEDALEFAAGKLDVMPQELRVEPGRSKYTFKIMTKSSEYIEALTLNHATFGRGSEDIISLSMIATTGMLVGARNQLGNLVGVGEFIFDREGAFYVYCICVAQGSEGKGIGECILDRAIKEHPGRRFWATVGHDNLNVMRTYFNRGFRMRRYLGDYFGDGMHQLLMEMVPGQDRVCGDYPTVDDFTPSQDAFWLRHSPGLDFSMALNVNGFEVVDARDDTCLLFKRGELPFEATSLKQNSEKLPFDGVVIQVTESADDALASSKLEKWAHGAAGEEPSTLLRIQRTGLLVCAKDEEGIIVGEVPVIFDLNDGLFCHGVAVGKGYDELDMRFSVMDYVEGLAKTHGKTRVWTVADTVDHPVMEVNINHRGYMGTQLILDLWGTDKHTVVVEKAIQGQPAAERPDWHSAVLLNSYIEFGKQDDVHSVLVHSTNYGLLKQLLDKGFRVVYVIQASDFKRREDNPKERSIFHLVNYGIKAKR
jgi:ribosomal protein S18 acetylase RimI-like enzyme